MGKRLAELLPGEEAIIVKIEDKSVFRKRLVEMGLKKGGKVQMLRNAPLGDPMEITVMGYKISLRRSEASYVIIDQVIKIA